MTRVLSSRLDQAQLALDDDIAKRLVALRRRAVQTPAHSGWTCMPEGRWRQWHIGLQPAIAACGIAVVLSISLGLGHEETALSGMTIAGGRSSTTASRSAGGVPVAPLEQLRMLSTQDDIDFYQSMDFLLWLEAQHD